MMDENDQLDVVQPPEAQTLLRALLVSGSSAQEIASACGVAKPRVFEWALGQHRPDPVSRIVLAEEYNIPIPAWRSKPAKQTGVSETLP